MEGPHLSYLVQSPEQNVTVAYILRTRLQLSRSLVTKLKQHSKIKVNGIAVLANYRVQPGDTVTVDLNLPEKNSIAPENLPLEIIYEDADFLVINKPPGMPVHPSRLHQSGTLANAVAYYWQQQDKHTLFRPINRLDKDTSGLILIGQNHFAHQGIAKQLAQKTVLREYTALVEGVITQDRGIIDEPIARKENSLVRVVVPRSRDGVSAKGQRAITHFRVLQRFQTATLVALKLETGRTHQIRVHLSFIGHPVCGDTLYGGSTALLGRQALHAGLLSFWHPRTGKTLTFTCPLPADMQKAIALLESSRRG